MSDRVCVCPARNKNLNSVSASDNAILRDAQGRISRGLVAGMENYPETRRYTTREVVHGLSQP